VKEETTPLERSRSTPVDPKEFRQLVDEMERIHHHLESLDNRANTLVHLLDILSKRVDRLEAGSRP